MARLDTLLDNDPFDRIDRNLLSHHDTDVSDDSSGVCEQLVRSFQLLEQYRAKHVAERARLREERQTKTVANARRTSPLDQSSSPLLVRTNHGGSSPADLDQTRSIRILPHTR